MKIDYSKLWLELDKRGVSKTIFRKKSFIGSSTYTKLLNNENVSTASLLKICEYLKCQLSDIAECIQE